MQGVKKQVLRIGNSATASTENEGDICSGQKGWYLPEKGGCAADRLSLVN